MTAGTTMRMTLLGIDIGSSSVKCAILRGNRIVGKVVRTPVQTRYEKDRAEVDPNRLLKALRDAVAGTGEAAKKVDAIGLSVMAPAWVAMDHEGRAMTPIVTHQDRRSVEIALQLEERVGRQRHLELAGNRPFPGGISSTTWAWFLRHQPAVMKKADLCGHLNTFLHRQMTGARVTDPSNASFMGFYSTLDQSGWCDELMEAVGIKTHRLPQVVGSETVGGLITRSAGRRFGLTHGTPVLAGCMDGSAAMLLAGNEPGQLVNASGSTDVLALCTGKPRPHERLLTRAVGVGRRWVSVSTLAAAGSALDWAHRLMFSELSMNEFQRVVVKLADAHDGTPGASARFEDYLAGDRMGMEVRHGVLSGLTLGTTREQVLAAVIDTLARAGAARLKLLAEVNAVRPRREVVVTGGVSNALTKVLYRDWPGRFERRYEAEATLRGLAGLV